MTALNYQVLVCTPGTTAADFTLGKNRLAEPFTVAGPIVRPIEGRAETQPWSFDVIDANSSFTAQLADSSSRLDMIGRLVIGQRDTTGSWKTVGAGRISDVMLNPDVASYRVIVEDEQMLTRNVSVFSTNTTRVWPACPNSAWWGYPGGFAARGMVLKVETGASHLTVIEFTEPSQYYLPRLPNQTLGQIRDDANEDADGGAVNRNPVAGSFKTLRFVADNTTYKVWSFPVKGSVGKDPDVLAGLDEYEQGEQDTLRVCVRSTAFGAVGSVPHPNYVDNIYLHMFAHEPTEATPLHIGGTVGIHPAQMVNDVFDGDYSTAGSLLPRYSSAALDTIMGYRDRGQAWWRITGRANMEEWLSANIYKPYQILPTVGSSGKIAHKSFWAPASTSQVTFTFTATNLGGEHPTWNHSNPVTVCVFDRTMTTPLNTRVANSIVLDQASGDGLQARVVKDEHKHDRMSKLGRHEISLPITLPYPTANMIEDVAVWQSAAKAREISQQMFNRYGDGGITGSMSALSSASTVQPGDFVKINLGTFPTPTSGGTRGSVRVVQILSRDDTPAGPNFTWVDAGKNAQPCTAPTVALSTQATSPEDKHYLTATIAGVLTGGRFELQLAHTTVAPTSGSNLWTAATPSGNTANGAFTLGAFPAGQMFFPRVRNTAERRIPSSWTTGASKKLAILTSPTGLASSSPSGNECTVKWTPGESLYPTALYLDDSTVNSHLGSKWTYANQHQTFRPGSGLMRYRFEQLPIDTKFVAAVRHFDNFGGFSTMYTTAGILPTNASVKVFATTDAADVLPKPFGLSVLSEWEQ